MYLTQTFIIRINQNRQAFSFGILYQLRIYATARIDNTVRIIDGKLFKIQKTEVFTVAVKYFRLYILNSMLFLKFAPRSPCNSSENKEVTTLVLANEGSS